MKSTVQADHIICGKCGLTYDRSKEFKHCSNCFACTGCEIYYCPSCEFETVVTPVKKAGKPAGKANKGRTPRIKAPSGGSREAETSKAARNRRKRKQQPGQETG